MCKALGSAPCVTEECLRARHDAAYVTSALGRLREDGCHDFEVGLDYIVSIRLEWLHNKILPIT